MRDEICDVYPELAANDFHAFWNGTIELQDDSDGNGVYIKVWNYSKPIPDGMKLGK